MSLRHFQLRFTLRATQYLALFHLIFVDIDLRGTLRAANHGSVLRPLSRKGWRRLDRERYRRAYYITWDMKSTPRGDIANDCARNGTSLANKWLLRANIRNVRSSVWEVSSLMTAAPC